MYLNIYGTDTVVNARNVNIYDAEDCLAQRWVARQSIEGGKLHTKIDEAFALNIHEEAANNCTMYNAQISGADSVLEFISSNVAANEYLIKMYHKDKYLRVANDDRGANVYWADSSDGGSTWKLVPESDMIFIPSAPGTMFPKDSSLVTKVMPAHTNNFTQNRSGQGATIEKITIHHMAGNLSIETLGNIWQRPDRKGSSHYGVNGTKVGQYVKESDIAWTDNNWESNKRSVTIETANSTGDPTWEIAGATYQTLIKLVADIARRNNFGTLVKGTNVTWHSMYSATQCPGPDLLRLMDSIVSEANSLNAEVDPEPPVTPSPTYEYGAVRHPETGKVYQISLQENFKEHIDPPYRLVDTRSHSIKEVNLLGILVSTVADDMFLDKYHANLSGYGLVSGALTAINQNISATRITVDYYEYNDIRIARLYCQDSAIDSVFINMTSLAYPPSFKDAAKAYAGIYYNESEVNTYCKNLYEKVTGLIGADNYEYDIEYVFNETRRKGNNYTGLVASKDKELYEYFFIRPEEKTNIVIKKSSFDSQKIDITEKISYLSKVDFDILNDFNIGTIE